MKKNLLFIELIVIILFFSLAAAACASLFAQAKSDSAQARDLTNAVILAQNAAELFKADCSGDPEPLRADGLAAVVAPQRRDGYATARVTVTRESDGAVLYELDVAVRTEESRE